MNAQERKVISPIIHRCIATGYTVSVHNGEAWALKRSSRYLDIMAALGSTDEDNVLVRRADGTKVGWIDFIYGNDDEVVADYSDNAIIAGLVGDYDPDDYVTRTHHMRPTDHTFDDVRCLHCGRPAHYWTQSEHAADPDAVPGSSSYFHCQAHRSQAHRQVLADRMGAVVRTVLVLDPINTVSVKQAILTNVTQSGVIWTATALFDDGSTLVVKSSSTQANTDIPHLWA